MLSELNASFAKIISLNNLTERCYESGISGISVLCYYDPEGVILKFVKGKLSIILTSRHITTTKISYYMALFVAADREFFLFLTQAERFFFYYF